MPYAVTCPSCGARFSVGERLVHERLTNNPQLGLKCRRCQAPIRLSVSHPPQPLAPNQVSVRNVPRPPLKKRDESPVAPAAQAAPPRKEPLARPRRLTGETPFAGLGPGLLATPGDVTHDLFSAPPPSLSSAVDLSHLAESEPPSAERSSSAPPLQHLTQNEPKFEPLRQPEDIDFLLGLSGSQGTAAVIRAPQLGDLTRRAPSEPPQPSEPSEPPPRAATPRPKAATPRPKATTPVRSVPVAPPNVIVIAPPPRPLLRRYGVVAGALLLAGAATGILSALAPRALGPRASQPSASASTVHPAELSASTAQPSDPPALSAAPALAAASTQPSAPPASVAARAKAPAAASPATPAKAAPERVASRSSPSEPSSAPAPRRISEPAAPATGAPFDRAAAAAALAVQAREAAACRKPLEPTGTASVTITFAPSGRATNVSLSGPPFAGTATGGCIAAALRRTKVPAFGGDKVTVAKTVVIQ